MGAHKNINAAKFPAQGELAGRRVKVCFHYDTASTVEGVCVRDDKEEPYRTIFKLADGRHVLATECQYSYEPGAKQ